MLIIWIELDIRFINDSYNTHEKSYCKTVKG